MLQEKQELIDLIEQKHDINALIEFVNKYRTNVENMKYAWQAFQDFEKLYIFSSHPKYGYFYSEYIRMCIIALNKNIVQNDPEFREHVEKIISIAISQEKGYLYSARFYQKMYEEHLPEYVAKKDIILSYYTQAEKSDDNAFKEKEKFLIISKRYERQLKEKERVNKRKLLHESYSLKYYNADINEITNIINEVLKEPDKKISILLYGPENAGMKEFACKLFALSNKNYTCITSVHIKNRYDFTKDADEILEDYDDFILYGINSCFYMYSRFEDNKDFVLEQNVQYVINKITEDNCSVALIVNDIKRLPQNLLDAFAIKIKFDYMNKEQKQSALKEVFNITSNALDETSGLVFGDFLRIKQKADLLSLSDENEIIEQIKNEADSKPNFLKYSTPVSEFDLNLINTNTDLLKLTTKLTKTTMPFTMLISGPAGTGKSYYLRYLASQMNMNVIEKTAAELFSKYQGEPAQNVLNLFKEAEDQNAVIILDEVEKITSNRGKDNNDKWRSDMTNAFLTCLENTKYPFMATTNFVSDIDKAILRRFVFKLNFDYLKPEQISYAFQHIFGLQAPSELFKIGGLTNGDFAIVKKKAQILDCLNDTSELYEMLKEEATVKAIGHVVHIEKEINFDRNFINIEGNALDLYIKQVKEKGIHNFSILLHGPSGTGKSLYLRHLAQDMGYEIIERRASDLLSKWHGESEQNIAAAFEEAKNRRAMLILDEIDSFLPNKSNLIQAYNSRIVNEFLIQLENHPYPIGATTNYIDHIERASIRRFKIDAKFDYLQKEQYGYIYRKTFGFEPPAEIEKLTELTPAIFALACEKVSLENVGTDEKRIFEIFLSEVKKATGQNPFNKEDKTYEKLTIPNLPLYTTPITENYNQILTGFVKVITDNGYGSGFVITGSGFILSNQHVVENQKIVDIELFSGRTIPGEVIRTNSLDVALIKISAENKVYPMPISFNEPNIGSSVFSLGNPKNQNQVLSKGCITRYTKNKNKDDAMRIETDCFTDSGSSGGPLLDEYGNVIGINVEGRLDTSHNIKLGLNLHLSIIEALNALHIKLETLN